MADLAASDVTYTPQSQGGKVVHRTSAREKRVLTLVSFGDGAKTYPSGGVPLTTTASDVDLYRAIRRWEIVDGDDGSGILWKVDHANGKLRGYEINTPAISAQGLDLTSGGGETIEVQDSDTAASTGVAMYLHLDAADSQGLVWGHLEAVTAGNADALFNSGTAAGGGVFNMEDDDAAATGGAQIYFDEDGTTGSRFLADLSSLGNADAAYVMNSKGQYLRIKHDASAATTGVAVYFDDDATNAWEKLLFVSPTDTAGTDELATYEFQAVATSDASMAELDAGSDAPAAQTLYMYAYGW